MVRWCWTMVVVGAIGATLAASEPPRDVPTGAAKGPRQPQVAVGAEGLLAVAFADERAEIYCVISKRGGLFFEQPVRVAAFDKLPLGMRRGPRIAIGAQGITITCAGSFDGGRTTDLYAWHSDNQGLSWSQPVRVNDMPGAAGEALHALAAGPDGALYSAWIDNRDGPRTAAVYGAASRDGGRTWLSNQLVYRSPEGMICPCCHPSVCWDSQGRVVVMWRNSLAGARDMYLARSADQGATFEEAVKLGIGAWPLNACPMDGGGVACIAGDLPVAAYRRDTTVYLADLDGRENELGPGLQPWIAATLHGPYIVWLSRRPGELLLRRPGSGQSERLAVGANDPVIAVPQGALGPVVAAWEEESPYGRKLRVSVIRPNSAGEGPMFPAEFGVYPAS